MFGTRLGTIHNGMTAIQLERIIQVLESLLSGGIPGIGNPSVGLHQDGRSEVLVGTPPVGRTGGGTAGTEDAFVHAIEFGPILFGLEELALATVGLGRTVGRLQPRFNGSIHTSTHTTHTYF